uniref:Uncharacterized protein n=1 Tax=Rhizophora mucronata TaxID=61149 RepID=A0A2P2NQM6_RHIMU
MSTVSCTQPFFNWSMSVSVFYSVERFPIMKKCFLIFHNLIHVGNVPHIH